MTKTGLPDTASSVTAALGELIEGLSAAVANLEERLAAVEAAVQQITERVTLDGILDCLNHEHSRATYGAVGQALGFPRDRAARMTGELMYRTLSQPAELLGRQPRYRAAESDVLLGAEAPSPAKETARHHDRG